MGTFITGKVTQQDGVPGLVTNDGEFWDIECFEGGFSLADKDEVDNR